MFKRLIIGVLILAMGVFGLVGCGRATVPNEPTHLQTNCGDFLLTLSVSSSTLLQGEDITVTAIFENLSGETHEVIRGFDLVYPFVVNSEFYTDAFFPMPIEDMLETDAQIISKWQIGSKLPKGKHELVAFSSFSSIVAEELPLGYLIYSNTIVLTVY